MDQKAYTARLMRLVIPATAIVTTVYSTGFTFAVATAPEPVGERNPADLVTSGELKAGWRYEIFQKSWPKSYTLDVRGVQPGAPGVCAIDVRGWPRPLMATPGPGATIRVVFDRPLEGMSSSMVTIDLMEGTRLACAVRVTNGVVMESPAIVRPPEPEPSRPIARAEPQPALAL
jgi:hypothetical protein